MDRLQKILSAAGVASRRTAEQLIAQGRVTVNGHTVTTLGTKAEAGTDDIRVDGRRLRPPAAHQYFLMFKPRGVVCTRVDPERRTTVIDLLQRAGIAGYFYPVGRLDYDSDGLLILTNDGALAERVAHPRHSLERTYEARVKGVPDAHDLSRLERGLVLDGRRTRPADARVQRVIDAASGPQAILELTLREGRNRQVRRMCDAIGHPVVRLRRTRIGGLTLDGLSPGEMRRLTPAEVRRLLTAPAVDRSADREHVRPKPDHAPLVPERRRPRQRRVR